MKANVLAALCTLGVAAAFTGLMWLLWFCPWPLIGIIATIFFIGGVDLLGLACLWRF